MDYKPGIVLGQAYSVCRMIYKPLSPLFGQVLSPWASRPVREGPGLACLPVAEEDLFHPEAAAHLHPEMFWDVVNFIIIENERAEVLLVIEKTGKLFLPAGHVETPDGEDMTAGG
jgi:hypothetical protein